MPIGFPHNYTTVSGAHRTGSVASGLLQLRQDGNQMGALRPGAQWYDTHRYQLLDCDTFATVRAQPVNYMSNHPSFPVPRHIPRQLTLHSTRDNSLH